MKIILCQRLSLSTCIKSFMVPCKPTITHRERDRMMNDQDEMIKIFDSADDDGLRSLNADLYAIHMLRWMNPKRNSSVMELACGNGRVAQSITCIRNDLDYACMDICPTLTKKAQQLNPRMKIYTGDCLKKIPYKAYGKYDQIISWGFVQYLSPDQFLNLNHMLLTHLDEDGEIWHFSIPDNTRRWIHNMGLRNTILSKLKGVLKYLVDSPKRYYAEACIWHDPEELQRAHEDSMIMQIIQPGDIDYRFHICIKNRSQK